MSDSSPSNHEPGAKFARWLFAAVCIAAAALHTAGFVTFDLVGLSLLVAALLPWASGWLESVRVGDFEAKFRQLEQAVDATQKQVEELGSIYRAMEEEYLARCADFDPDAPARALDQLASDLKARAKGLGSIEFLFRDLADTRDQGLAFGAACALQVRPQFHAIDGLVALLQGLSLDADLRGFRLKTVYRLLMGVEEIVKLDTRSERDLLAAEQRTRILEAMAQIAAHPRCRDDDTGVLAGRIVGKLGGQPG